MLCDRFTFPDRSQTAEWLLEAASSLTVAGPRRIHTGLPCYAPRGHPNKTLVISRARPDRRPSTNEDPDSPSTEYNSVYEK